MKEVFIDEYGFKPTEETFEDNVVYSWKQDIKLITSKRDMIHCDHLEATYNPEFFIFCSRHRAQSGKPAFLVHSTGNFGEDSSFGGKPFSLSVSAPSIVAQALLSLKRERDKRGLNEFDVTMEVTHHGPTEMNTPLVFIELGSDEFFWEHKDGAQAVAASIIDCITTSKNESSSIGFGGTHYASKFNKLILERGAIIGHIAPKYALDKIHPSVVKQMILRSMSVVETAIIDWKGTNASQKEHLFPILQDLGIEVMKARDF